MKVWIFNHYAQPPTYPGGTRHFDLAKSMNKSGLNVTIFSSSYHYTLLKELLPKWKLSSKKSIDGVDFVLLKTVGYKKNGISRLFNILTYPLSLIVHLIFTRFDKPNVIIGSTVHPFAGLIGSIVSRFLKVPHVFEIRDLWPETFIDMSVWKKDSIISKLFYSIESYTVRNSNAFIVLSPMTIDYLVDKYNVDKSKILLLPNGVNDSFYDIKNSFHSLKSRGEISIKYVGGLDSVHGLDFLVDLAVLLPEGFNVILVGDGKDKDRLIAKTKLLGLKNVEFLPPVPKKDVPRVMNNSDLLFLSTADVFYGSENKLYEYMAVAKPIVVASNAEHNNPVIDIGCGVVLDRRDPTGSANKLIDYVHKNAGSFDNIGMLGHDYVIKNQTVTILSNKLMKFLQGVRG